MHNFYQNSNVRWTYAAWNLVQRALGLLLLLVCMPLLAVLFIIVKLDSHGPFLYMQKRPGRYGELFSAYKVRTMSVGADKNPTLAHAVTADAPEITRVGRYLRDLKLDELPQLWNIVRGDMVFVGPRPIAPSLQDHLEKHIPGFETRLMITPGLTSLGQICINENEDAENVVSDWKVRFEGEQHYLLNRNVVYDLMIITLTAGYCLRKVTRSLSSRFSELAVVLCSVAIVGCSTSMPLSSTGPDGFVQTTNIPASETSSAIKVETVSVASLPPGTKELIYRLGPSDKISVNIFGEPGLESVVVQLDGNGDVQLPLLSRVGLASLSLNEAQDLLEAEYGKHFIDPWVVVQLEESLSRPIYLLGAFNQAGVVQMTRPTNVIHALSAGEGLMETAYTRGARLIRNGEVAAVDIHSLLNFGRLDQNVWLLPDDTIFVPGTQDLRVYVLGAIYQPGAQTITNGPVTLVQAIAEAGGPLRRQANLKHVRVIRALSPVSGELYVIDYKQIISGDSFDMPLEPGDIVYVPPNGMGSWNEVIEAISPTITVISKALDPFVLAKAIQD